MGKVALGGFLVTVCFLFVPSIQRFISRICGIRRIWLSYTAVSALVLFSFAITPVHFWRIIVGLMFVGIATTVMWIVPRNVHVNQWMQEMLFGGNNILDEKAPYAKVVNLFKWPLFGLGVWVIVPWALILLDIIPIAGALVWWARQSSVAAKKESRDRCKTSTDVISEPIN